MSISLHSLPKSNNKKKKKRVGRGDSSGRGTYSGRGLKGQKSRSGGKSGLKLKGLQQIMKHIPKKKGFTSLIPKNEIINLDVLEKNFNEGETVNAAKLKEKKLINTAKNGVKVLGRGKITKKFTLKGCLISGSAKKAIEEAGGTIK